MKRLTVYFLAGLAGTCVSSAAFAHADIGVYLGVPGPVYAAPVYQEAPPVVYEAPPPVVYQAAPAYYGYGYRYDDDEHHWHDHGHHRGWEHHHRDDD